MYPTKAYRPVIEPVAQVTGTVCNKAMREGNIQAVECSREPIPLEDTC